jgi:hypothetical protein
VVWRAATCNWCLRILAGCVAGASVPPLPHSSADELAHHMSVGVAVWRASAPRTTQQGQA